MLTPNGRAVRCERHILGHKPLLVSATKVPIYEYVCMECESHFEELVRNADQQVSCPDCSAEKVVKQFSVFAAHGTAAQPSFGGGGGCCGGSCGCGH